MNPIFVSIFFVFALSPNLLAWNLFGHRPAWLQDARSEMARMGQQIRDSVRELKLFSLGSAWVPLTRIGDDYIAQMSQRNNRIKELRREIHRLRQIGKACEAAEEELLRLIELGTLPEKRQERALEMGLDLTDAAPGELSLPVSGEKHSVPGICFIPGAGDPSPQSEPFAGDVGQDLSDPWAPGETNEPFFKRKKPSSKDLILVLRQVLQSPEVGSDQELRNVLSRHLERLLEQTHDDDLEKDQLEMHQQLAQLFNLQGEIDGSVREALTLHVFSFNSVRTQSMRVDPLSRAEDSYPGPRASQDVPALEWSARSSQLMTFEEAEAYAASHSSEGWRLPTIWELEALYQQRSALEEDDQSWYWSNTLVGGYAWLLYFYSGQVESDHMSNVYYVRCVR
ncbi:MAG: DUF1566 domain-containing protein [Myxococcaceae bacterium]|nr:DUF1566 domain-containing protein [Myxococcaceae bacterium]MBH2006642.1 DUF1566 domain-containing protein [Myxococcaceae bacterium]